MVKKRNNNSPLKNIALLMAHWVKKRSIMTNTIVPWFIREEIGMYPNVSTLSEIKKKIIKIAKSKSHIVIGPWLSEVGFEVLYWIPFINWFMDSYKIDRKNVTVVSRGGTALWYKTITENYIDIFDYFTEDEFREKNIQRISSSNHKGQKHIAVSSFDKEIFKRVWDKKFGENYTLFHPSLMYNLFRLSWRDYFPVKLIDKFTHYKRFVNEPINLDIDLPEKFIAAKFYFSDSFPQTDENIKIIKSLLVNIAQYTDVVLLNTEFHVDDHDDIDMGSLNRIHTIKQHLKLQNNLEVQTNIIRKSVGFIGTYGGFSYIPQFYGIPSVALYSRADKFLPIHLDVAQRAIRVLKYGEFGKVKNYSGFTTNDNPEFIAVDVRNMSVLNLMFPLGEKNDSIVQRFAAL